MSLAEHARSQQVTYSNTELTTEIRKLRAEVDLLKTQLTRIDRDTPLIYTLDEAATDISPQMIMGRIIVIPATLKANTANIIIPNITSMLTLDKNIKPQRGYDLYIRNDSEIPRSLVSLYPNTFIDGVANIEGYTGSLWKLLYMQQKDGSWSYRLIRLV